MKHLLTALATILSMFTRRVPTIHVRVQDYGVLGMRVYIAHNPTAELFRSLTGNRSLTRRHVQSLVGLGYRVQLNTYEPTDVPAWLAPFLHDAHPVIDVRPILNSWHVARSGSAFDA